ncbi:hypothetical protein [Glaciimonas immobilis]|uniref:Chemotaxis protein histidine kinase CheA n=1 Tax=Glaciimonas immobilis TaxID=728004 RepID=A0A840RPE7_9BURK|nr:hypothetical protein [Glaciimonas immobilis]KAF3999482.1 hypothetical protein HAV38_06085 [Glaciimonas immobilis]MBB5199002.1 chemotaxis protein histidine kinase CheA [Glaciimonas immobilis]
MTGTASAQDGIKVADDINITSDSKQVSKVSAGQEDTAQSVSPANAPPENAQSAKDPVQPSAQAVDNLMRDPNSVFDSSIPAAEFIARHPPGSVTSVTEADAVLTDVTKARTEVELRNLNEQRVCYKKFFTTYCLNAAKEQRRLALKQIRPLEVEANAFKRRATADDRDKALAEQQAKTEASAPKVQQDQKDKELSNANKVKEGAAKNAAVQSNTKLHAGEAEKRVSDNANKLQSIKQAEAARASERAANRAAFIKKGQDAAARQKVVAAKKAEKARQLAAKKAASAPVVTPLPKTVIVPSPSPSTPSGTTSVPAAQP